MSATMYVYQICFQFSSFTSLTGPAAEKQPQQHDTATIMLYSEKGVCDDVQCLVCWPEGPAGFNFLISPLDQ